MRSGRARSAALRLGGRAALALAAAVATACSPAYVATPPPARDPSPPPRSFTVRVERVVDGDTFIARHRGQRLRVRLIGVDAPESVMPGAPVECWGPESSRLMQRLLPAGSTVRVAYQPGGRRDRYGRELWDVWLADGRFLQGVLVRRGAAVATAYGPQVAHAAHLESLERRARENRRGLHGACPA